MFRVEIVEAPARRLLGLRHQGPYPEIGPIFGAVFDVIGHAGLLTRREAMIGVYFEDPAAVAPADVRSFMGVQMPVRVTCPDGLEDLMLEAGPHAVLRHSGPYSGLPRACDQLCGTGMSDLGRRPSGTPSFEGYLNDPTDTPPPELMAELWAPLVPL